MKGNPCEVPFLPPPREPMGPPFGRKGAPSLVRPQVGVWGGQEVWGGFLEAVWPGAGSRRTVAHKQVSNITCLVLCGIPAGRSAGWPDSEVTWGKECPTLPQFPHLDQSILRSPGIPLEEGAEGCGRRSEFECRGEPVTSTVRPPANRFSACTSVSSSVK